MFGQRFSFLLNLPKATVAERVPTQRNGTDSALRKGWQGKPVVSLAIEPHRGGFPSVVGGKRQKRKPLSTQTKAQRSGFSLGKEEQGSEDEKSPVLTQPRILNGANFAPTWQGQKESNPRHAVLETAALPAELYP